MSKTIFITGTSTGFGKLTAITLANAGHLVIAGMRNTKDKNVGAANELNALANIEVVDIDITNDDSVGIAFEKIITKYGKIDVLINNAAVSGFGLLEGYSIEQVQKMFDVNVYSVLPVSYTHLRAHETRIGISGCGGGVV